jgi:hypothetical protein
MIAGTFGLSTQTNFFAFFVQVRVAFPTVTLLPAVAHTAPALIVTFVAAWTGVDVVTARRQRKTPVMNLLVVTFTGVSLLSIVITSLVSIL